MNRRFFFSVLVVLAIVLPVPSAQAEPAYRVIVNPDNPTTSLSKDQVGKMLLKKTTAWKHGGKVLPVDLKVTSKIRNAMSKSIHGRSARAIKSWWNQQIFAGKGVPPTELGSDAKVVSYVLANPGAIGYVSAGASIGDAKVVTITE
jgi:ABC-type phosphate transport system substrate-binding protein